MNKQTRNQLLRPFGGNKAEFARALGIDRYRACRWINRGWFPDKWVKPVSKITGIPPEKLRRPL